MNMNRLHYLKMTSAGALLSALNRQAFCDEESDSDSDTGINFTYEDIKNDLAVIEASVNGRKASACGFIMMMDDQPYLITNQHSILGMDRLKFVSPAGRSIKPRKIELSTTSDIARLALGEGDGLRANSDPAMGDAVAVFGNNGEGGAKHEIHGKINGVGADIIEVTAEFTEENSGAPVLNEHREVIAMASYTRDSRGHIMKKGTRFEDRTRRFCHRLHHVKWQPVNWKKFNATFGKAYQESRLMIDDMVQVLNNWADGPLDAVRFDGQPDKTLAAWIETHNEIVAQAVNIGKGRREFYAAYSESAEKLVTLCEGQSREMVMLSEQRGLTDFLIDEFDSFGATLEQVADIINRYGSSTY